jgi:hypothetical protein
MERDPVSFVQDAIWDPELVLMAEENIVPTGFDPRTFQLVASVNLYIVPAISG